MVGVGETYLPAFALAVGLGEIVAGLVGSLPLLAGGLIQSISPWIVRKGVSERTWILSTALVQAAAFVPLIITAMLGSVSPIWLLVFASIYWAGGLATGPAWNSWIEKIIPKPIRTNYFACRTRASQVATLLGFLVGGLSLHISRQYGYEVAAFTMLFALACVTRVFSVMMLAAHKTVEHVSPTVASQAASQVSSYKAQATTPLNGPKVLPFKASISAKHLIVYLVIVQGMVQISGPFFTPYMLKHLHLSYMAYAGLMAVAFLAKIIAIGAWGRLAKRRGAQWLLTVGGAAIVPLAPMWMVSEEYAWLVGIQAINGVAWAAYELGFFLMFFESMPIQQRIKMLTLYNLANTSAWCLGSTLGAVVLSNMGSSPTAYYTLFVISACGRAVAFGYLLTHRSPTMVRVRELGFRILGMRTNAAPLETPILATLDNAPRDLPEDHRDDLLQREALLKHDGLPRDEQHAA